MSLRKKALAFLWAMLSSVTTFAQTKQTSPPYEGYLFAYFEGSGDPLKQEQLRLGISKDAIHWSALNHNQPILDSSDISQTGGIRDPHLLRGQDGNTF